VSIIFCRDRIKKKKKTSAIKLSTRAAAI